MPLRLLKRNCKQYNVVSKSTSVISVELLDNNTMECTLDAESTGRDCLLNISQRLGLHQPEFFGLRYISRGVPPRQRWVELDRPLRKQLEKNAQDSQLSLGVMFYVNDVNLLKDEMARYYFFLQLKSDVIEGKLNCSLDQAVSLAAYSLQSESGDFDPERHTVEYLRDFGILPKEFISGQKYPQLNVDALYEAVVRQYASLSGFPTTLAEIYYIMLAQQLDGYGQEPYPAKDDHGNDILICVSSNGLIIRRRDWTHIAAFRWNDIKSLIGHKKLFVVESAQSHRTMQYHFADPEVAKYVRKICILQSSFCKENFTNENARNNISHIEQDIDSGNQSFSMGPLPVDSNLSSSVTGSSFSQTHSSFNQSAMTNSLNSSPYAMQVMSHGNIPLPMANTEVPLNSVLRQLSPDYQNREFISHVSSGPNIVRTNPLALSNFNGSETGDMLSPYSGYGRAVSDYAAALQQKYGTSIQDLSAGLKTPSKFFIAPAVTPPASNNENEPIYQNEIVSQIHSMELRESTPSSSSADVAESSKGSQLITTTSVPPISEETPVYVFKPPPPYPGININGSSSQEKFKSSSESSVSESKDATYVNSQAIQQHQHSGSIVNTSVEVHTDSVERFAEPATSSVKDEVTSHEKSQNGYEESPNCISVVDGQSETTISTAESSAVKLFGKPIDSNILLEFQNIPKTKDNPVFSTAMKKENSKRNRYPGIVPYEDNMVKLTPTRHNPSGYVNASPVNMLVGDRKWMYVVAQIPLTGYGAALWQMVWESDVKVIVSLERDSSALFYPLQVGSTMNFNEYQIQETKSDRRSSASIAREFTLVYVPKKKQRKVWVLPYEEEWKDDVPIHTEHFLCFLEEVNSIQRKVSEPSSPLTVLCATGAGRCGVFILSDLLLHAADCGHKLRCDDLLRQLRMQRMCLLSSVSQYAFVLHTLAKYLAQSRLI